MLSDLAKLLRKSSEPSQNQQSYLWKLTEDAWDIGSLEKGELYEPFI